MVGPAHRAVSAITGRAFARLPMVNVTLRPPIQTPTVWPPCVYHPHAPPRGASASGCGNLTNDEGAQSPEPALRQVRNNAVPARGTGPTWAA